MKGFEMGMLVLTREPDQEIMIGDFIRVMVVKVSGNKVRLGVTAPPDIPVNRSEVYKKIQKKLREQGRKKS